MSYIRLIDVQQIRQRNRQQSIPPYHEVYSNANYPEGWKDIDPFESYRSVFNGQIDILSNPELILAGVEILEGKVSGIWWFTSYHLPLPDGIQVG
ncbi:hypothetical protein [Bacteroides thetaiotaomicron]|uniref:hypothetical protein n=1 Tax=Bacteroides thetaiotaomicron TaxID=818 RepID=UPI0021655CAD|nr:hypothetical protein [Bacteroides thetaiotaomicron]MCS2207887.1 hypothetical protein [Bacteroides thetaiotaomicron]